MAQTEAQRRASLKYVRERVKQKAVAFYPSDRELLKFAETRGAFATYVKRLIREDMERERDILRELSESEGPLEASVFTDGSRTAQLVAFHFEIMDEAGLIEADVSKTWGGGYARATAIRLTWDGADFLAAVSNDGMWSHVKRSIAKSVGSASLETIKALAVKLAMERLSAL